MPKTIVVLQQNALAALNVVDEEDEAAWEDEFSDAVKVGKFARWARESLAREEPRQIDPARL